MMAFSTVRAGLAASLIGLACAGCLGGGPAPSFYTLSEASGPAAGTPIATLPELGLVVGPIEIPRYLDRPEIVTRDGANELVVADAHRWGGSLRNDILRVVADDLGRLLGTPRVTIYPNEPRFPASFRILLDIREFGAVQGQRVVLRVRWTIARIPDGSAAFVADSRFEQSVASASMADNVAAQSAALGTLIRQIAEKLAALPAR